MDQTPVFRFLAMDVKPVALAGYRATLAGNTLVVPGLANKMLQFSSKFSHWGIVKQVMKHIMQPLPPRNS
jgi:short-subunit dehydrogenase